MRYSKEHKEQTRQRLLAEASAAIMAEGPEQLGVAALMARLGLTHGGFYAHFKSKDDLVEQAIAESCDKGWALMLATTSDRPPAEALGAYVDAYLSMTHVRRTDWECPLPALSGDLSRMTGASRDIFAASVLRLTERVATLLQDVGVADAQVAAASAVAEMAGAVSLARAIGDGAQAEAILAGSRQSVKARLGLD